MSVEISFQRLDPELPPPGQAHEGDAAIDLAARESVTLGPGERAMVPTGIAVAIPSGYGGLVIPRSGLAARHGISVVNGPGLIDSGFRGEVHVIVVNLGSEPYEFRRGDRIAQLMIVPAMTPRLVEVETLPESSRGVNGFGSSGR